jgi:NDP-4-keto-2,6-dideoxyhexose 3-C-methyltransferase
METKEINKCRVCGSDKLEELFSVGDLYLSTFVEKEGDHIGHAPMDLVWCDNCTLVQLKHTAPQELMYSGYYWYKSGLNKIIIDDLKEITEVASDMVDLKEGDVVLDIGANDGTLLSFYSDRVVRVGCEPATNLIEDLKKNCEVVIDKFWEIDNYKEKMEDKKVKVITAIGMFYDMDDPGQFIRDAAAVLDENGVFIAQLMTSKKMIEINDLGNICHEHLEFYSYESLKHLFEKNGLEIFMVQENGINGGSYRLFARHLDKGSIDYNEDIDKESYLKFGERIKKNKEECVKLIKKLKDEGKKIYVYGASTKGNTILQYFGLDKKLIKGAAEIHPEKIGKFTVGTSIPIINEEEAKKDADYFLVLPFAFRDNFIKREEEWLNRGGKFIFCTPKVEIVEGK